MPEDQPNGSRVANVEQDIRDIRRDIHNLHDKIDGIAGVISMLREADGIAVVQRESDVRALETSMESLKGRMCPNPGACTSLEPRITNLENRMSTWEATKQQAIGAGKLVKSVWFLLGAGGLSAIHFLLKKLGL